MFEPRAAIYEAALGIAEELGLPENWLNDAAKTFMPGDGENARPLPDIHGVETTIASARYLLVMKLMATRIGEDDEDIEVLIRECKSSSAQEALELLAHMYPTHEPSRKTRLFLETLFEDEAD